MRLNFKRLALLGAHSARGVAKLARLTPARLDLVTVLMHGPLCQRDLAVQLCVSEGVVSRLVHALMALGFVQRQIPVADRRYRVVSLTKFARYEYEQLTEAEWLMEPHARFDVQGLGEATWLGDWHDTIERINVGYLQRMAADDRDELSAREPPYAAFRLHLDRGAYRDALADNAFDKAVSPWDIALPAPPLQHGVLADAISDALLVAWRPPREISCAYQWKSPHGPGPE